MAWLDAVKGWTLCGASCHDILEAAVGPHRRGGGLRPEVFVVASTGLATFVAGAAGLLQDELPVAVPALAVAAMLGSWALYRQLRIPASAEAAARHVPSAVDIVGGGESVGAAARVVPRQLPAAVPLFAGRAGEVAWLTGLLRDQKNQPVAGAAVMISAIGGTAGVGKTALAVYWAHQVAEEFPDGQLFVNLRGFDPAGSVMDPAEAVRRFLDALQVPPQRIPQDLDAQAALYRSELAGRRMLIVLDNARDSVQVRPLLPGAATCLVLVTSRNQLSGLVAADGAHPITLDLFTRDETRQLLTRRLGPARVAAEPGAVEQIITACARLPLALAIVAARAANQSHLPLHALADGLHDNSSGGRLDTLSTDDPATDVRAVLSWSYEALTPAAARLFRLLGLHPGPDTSAAAAASLAAVPLPEARALLGELTRASLLVESVSGRYTFHDLLRAYAAEQAHRLDLDQQRHAATHRLLDHYLHTAHTAVRLLQPARDPITLTPPQLGVIPEHPTDYQQAVEWFTDERPVLLAAVDHAVVIGFDTHTWQLAWTLDDFLGRRGHWHDQVAAGQAAVAAAGRLADPAAQARAHRRLAASYIRLGRLDDAHTQQHHALDLTAQAGDLAGQGHTHLNLGQVWERRGRPADALHHTRQALDLFRAAGHRRGQAHALNNIGWYHALLGDHQQTLTHCQQALPLHQELDDRHGQAAVWDSLGYAHHHLGHHDQAITCYQHALDLYRDLGDRYHQATILTHLGDTHHTTGNLQTARDTWQQALAILEQLEHPDAHAVRVKFHHPHQTPQGEQDDRKS
ncbi:hypothetical protein Rhe02_03340 [Rhizocola hellebori]|uniref:Tetratricopeptide repeat protein n=1 Tax=Rhizocola hellebori TaxID=1392758 RepID=A0A8J3Q2K6_9ACTN|nr:tetratricopeptide repeat protein [Rhizocola hellebori]GIH02267.1 hypothetical protein Rhe02_03340 [Rhizocola hellebori]